MCRLNITRRLVGIAVAAMSAMTVSASDCQIMMGIAPMDQGEGVPEAVGQRLSNRLANLMAQEGVVAGDDESRFFVSGRFDNGFFDRNSNGNYLVKTTLTLFIGDAEGKKMFASRQFELKGAGKTEQLAYINALSSLNARNPQFQSFVADGREKVVNYFNSNYKTYLTRARTALETKNYDEAFYYALSIPECCVGYDEAVNLVKSAYTDQVNDTARRLLAQAKAAWAAHPDEAGAEEAHSYLTQIDPDASCYGEAMALSKSIGQTVKKNWDFENVTKYKDAVALEKQRIESARAIGVAWAKNQPKTVNRYYWVSHYRY